MKRTYAAAAALVLAALPFGARAAAPPISLSASRVSAPSPRVILDAIRAGHRLGAVAPSRSIALALSLRPRDQAGLDRLVRAEYTPGSPLYHHWLTPALFARRFAPTPVQRAGVEGWLRHGGLRVMGTTRNGLEITATGSARNVEALLRTPLALFTGRHGPFIGNVQPAQVPGRIAGTVQAIAGLNGAATVRPLGLGTDLIRHDSAGSADIPLTPAQTQTLYNMTPLRQAGMDGSGQTVALFQLTDYDDGDIAAFDQQFNLPAPDIERIPVAGGAGLNENQPEAELDIEMVHAMAPAAKILVYEGSNDQIGIPAIWNRIVSDDRASVISSSYGAPESVTTPEEMDALNTVFEEAAAQGQAIFNASGDSGAFDGVPFSGRPGEPDAGTLQVDFPASSPWVTAVGGTELSAAPGGIVEEAWSDPENNDAGAGGGVSSYWTRPWYQTGPGVDNQYSTGYRQVPDVSALAANPYYAMYTLDNDGNPNWVGVGGTSASCPLWAGYAALLNQYLGAPTGFLNPTLYTLGNKAGNVPFAPFHDVTTGTNLHYPATPGWDFASGWGTMDGIALAGDVKAMGVSAAHPSDFSTRVWVAARWHGQWIPETTVYRGKAFYLVDQVTYNALPDGSTPTQRTFSLSSATHVAARQVTQGSVDRSAVGQSFNEWVKVKALPWKTPTGTYTVTLTYRVGDATHTVTTRVNVD